jgi:hypothetical protein
MFNRFAGIQGPVRSCFLLKKRARHNRQTSRVELTAQERAQNARQNVFAKYPKLGEASGYPQRLEVLSKRSTVAFRAGRLDSRRWVTYLVSLLIKNAATRYQLF